MATMQGGFSFNNFLGTSALGDMRIDINELDDRALFIDGTKSMTGTLGMGGNLIVGFSAVEGQELAVGILPATGHVSIYAKADKMLYIQDDTGLETNITGGGSGLTGVTDTDNTLLGIGTGVAITTAVDNTLVGVNAGNALTDAVDTIMIGDNAGLLNNIDESIYIGSGAGIGSVAGVLSMGIGFNTLQSITSGTGNNTATGWESQRDSISGGSNTSHGSRSLQLLISGSANSCFGHLSGTNVNTGSSNTYMGHSAGLGNGITNNANSCAAYGASALAINNAGDNNSAFGASAGNGNNTGSDNLYLGFQSGINHNAAETNNIIIANNGVAGEDTTIRIGTFATQTSCFVAGISGVIPAGIPQAVIFDPTTGELGEAQITMDGAGAMTNISHMDMDHTAIESDDHAMEIDVDAAGFGDVKALDIVYITGNISAANNEEAILVNIDETLSSGGRVVALEVLATDQGSAEIDALECGVGCNPILHQSGTFIDADVILNIAADVTTALSGGGAGNITLWANDNDTFTVQDAAKYSEMEMIFDIFASGSGISPLFEFSSGSGPTTFTAFSPSDGTNGGRNNGVILWNITDVGAWVVGDSGNFEIRITRTRNTLTTTPRCDLVQISATAVFEWNKDGDLVINDIIAADVTCDTVKLIESGGADTITLQSPALAASYTLTFPIDDGDNLEVLETNGAGVLSWVAQSTGSGAIIRQWGANDFINSTDAAWSVSDLAPSIPDPSFAALSVRSYDASSSEAVGMKVVLPPVLTSINVRISFRKSTSASGTVGFHLLAYALDDSTLVTADTWSTGHVLHSVDNGSDQDIVKFTVNFTLATLGLTQDEDCLFQISRNIADTYAADVYLLGCEICVG